MLSASKMWRPPMNVSAASETNGASETQDLSSGRPSMAVCCPARTPSLKASNWSGAMTSGGSDENAGPTNPQENPIAQPASVSSPRWGFSIVRTGMSRRQHDDFVQLVDQLGGRLDQAGSGLEHLGDAVGDGREEVADRRDEAREEVPDVRARELLGRHVANRLRRA